MPVMKKDVNESKGFNVVPGTWLVKIPSSLEMSKKTKAGIEVTETKNTTPKFEMWKCIIEVIEDPTAPGAPVGAHVFENLTWDGPLPNETKEQAEARKAGQAEGRIYRLLRCMGHPVDAWKQSTTPVNIVPEWLYDRPFVMKLKRKFYKADNGETRDGLEGDGFMPFFDLNTKRGPAPDAPQKTGPAGSGGAPGSFNFGANAAPATGAPAPAAPPAAAPQKKAGLW